jgi:cell division protein FtsW
VKTQRGLRNPTFIYRLLLGATLFLTFGGLVMVWSASGVWAQTELGSPYALLQRQAMFVGFGIALMLLLSRMPVRFFMRIAGTLLIVALILLVIVLIPGIGVSVNGQQNWIDLGGPFRIQPSEFAKYALMLWTSTILAKRLRGSLSLRELLVPVVPMSLVIIFLVILEGDLGTATVMVPIIAGVLFAAGAPLWLFALAPMGLVALIAALSVNSGYRLARFTSWLDPYSDYMGAGWQVVHGHYALASGGLLGVGMGASREKWGALPEAHTDFIFAVIGEELGLWGTTLTLAMVILVGVCGLIIARRTSNTFIRLASVGSVAWITGQSLVNIGVVLGLLPVVGVPLPLVSYGGSSLIPTLAALGTLMAFARHEARVGAKLNVEATQALEQIR